MCFEFFLNYIITYDNIFNQRITFISYVTIIHFWNKQIYIKNQSVENFYINSTY